MKLFARHLSLQKAAIVFFILVVSLRSFAQLPVCSGPGSGLIYSLQGNVIMNYDPSQPPSPGNPTANTIVPPAGASGLAVNNNINGGGPSPTFYAVVGANYYYYNGITWVNTGHTSGAVNPCGSGNFLYSLIGGTGEVYKYDGTGNATLLMTVTGFNSGGPYDLQGDGCGNFYILKMTNTPYLQKYDPSGVLLNSWTVTGSNNSGSGGGMAIIGNTVYCHNGSFLAGTMVGSNVNFTPITGVTLNPSDFAACSLGGGQLPNAKASIDTGYYCGTGPGIPVSITGGPVTSSSWSVLSGPATIIGSGTNVILTSTDNAKVVMEAVVNNPCGGGTGISRDTVTIIVPTAQLDAGLDDTIYGCGQYIDTLRAFLTGTTPGVGYQLAWTPAGVITAGSNSLRPTVNLVNNTTFYITATTSPLQGGCSWKDSVKIALKNEKVLADFSYNIFRGCLEDTVEFINNSITANTPMKYYWDFNYSGKTDTAKEPDFIYKKHNFYTVRLYTRNGYCRDSIDHAIDLNHPIEALFDFTDARICQGDTIQFDGSSSIITLPTPYPKFRWNFGDGSPEDTTVQPRHAFPDAAVYGVRLIVTDSLNCVDTVVHTVDNIIPLPFIDIGTEDTTICKGEKLYLPLGISARGDRWVWSDGNKTPQNIVTKSGTYIVQLYNECGFWSDTAKVTFKDCTLFIPSAFTPNGDGHNDVLHLVGNLFDVSDVEISIFNRWGNRVFYSLSKEEGWDGTFNADPQPVGAYFYYVKYTLHGEKYEAKGDVVLIR